MIKGLIITLLIIFLLNRLNISFKIKECFSIYNQVNILSKNEIEKFINEDKDNFIKNLTKQDLSARNVLSIEEYKQNIINNICSSLNVYQKIKLINSVRKATQLMNKYLNVTNLQWNIVFICNKVYENGFPHTRDNLIFLNKEVLNRLNKDLICLLIHEQIHILQREYVQGLNTYNFITNFMKNYKVYSTRDEYRKLFPNIRSNPDLDDKIYINSHGQIFNAIYNNENPRYINDIVQDFKYEHPFEKMAYEISENLISKI